MESIGRQVRLPISTAFQISLQGIKIRLGRALVTISGVVLGIAFLMSVLAGNLINHGVSAEKAIRNDANMMVTVVRGEIGETKGKTVAIASFGKMSEREHRLVTNIVRSKPAVIRALGLKRAGVTEQTAANLGRGADILLVLGNQAQTTESLATLTTGMKNPLVLDVLADRKYAADSGSTIKPIAIFGTEAADVEAKRQEQERQDKFRTSWIVVLSLLVTVIGISNALLMSVTERFKEIGTMKCLGALSAFIRQLFLIESALIGLVGSIAGIILGTLFPIVAYGATYGFSLVMSSISGGQLALSMLACLCVGTLLSILAAIYPANFAAKMLPASALRSNI